MSAVRRTLNTSTPLQTKRSDSDSKEAKQTHISHLEWTESQAYSSASPPRVRWIYWKQDDARKNEAESCQEGNATTQSEQQTPALIRRPQHHLWRKRTVMTSASSLQSSPDLCLAEASSFKAETRRDQDKESDFNVFTKIRNRSDQTRS